MSASMNPIAWNSAIGRPNCTRSFANAHDSSSARVAAPTVRAPIMIRSSTNQSFVSSKPWPTSPRTAPSSSRTSWNAKIGCSNTNVCMYFGVRTSSTPGGVLVDEEDGGLLGIAVDVGVHEEEVGDVARGDVPLLAVQDPRLAVADRRRSTIVGSEPACSSVIAYASRRSPRIAGRRYRSFCVLGRDGASGIDGRHGMSHSAPVALPHSSSTRICWNVSSP